ncbi:MAG: flavodoxin family protein [Firmicutes bacterium]|jgi:multimeric flavodoxin WrbA|nr:flavodoxin family protein [Bacillota bacterium]
MRLTAIVGSYRKDGIINRVVDEILSSAREQGAQTNKIFLIDKHIEFCTNCRLCTQEKDLVRGECVIPDEMQSILDEIEQSDALIIASPMNFGTITAVMKKFNERLACYFWWPWGEYYPKKRNIPKNKWAVIVASSAAPGIIARFFFTGMVKQLKEIAQCLGAKNVNLIFVGLSAVKPQQELDNRTINKACRLGRKLIS